MGALWEAAWRRRLEQSLSCEGAPGWVRAETFPTCSLTLWGARDGAGLVAAPARVEEGAGRERLALSRVTVAIPTLPPRVGASGGAPPISPALPAAACLLWLRRHLPRLPLAWSVPPGGTCRAQGVPLTGLRWGEANMVHGPPAPSLTPLGPTPPCPSPKASVTPEPHRTVDEHHRLALRPLQLEA